MSEILNTAVEFNRKLRNYEKVQVVALIQRWSDAERRIKKEIDSLIQAISLLEERGEISLWRIFQLDRLKEFQKLLNEEIQRYNEFLNINIRAGQAEFLKQGFNYSIQTLGIEPTFKRPHFEALRQMVGIVGDKSPLTELLNESFKLTQDLIRQELVNAVALGWNPRKTARKLVKISRVPIIRATRIARTEQLRAFRFASLESFRASGVVIGYKRRSARDERVCAGCLAADGRVYDLETEFEAHVNCRCAIIPIIKGEEEVKWQSGEDWLSSQPKNVQMKILGKSGWELWKEGLPFENFADVKHSDIWGNAIIPTSVKKLKELWDISKQISA